jgi:hypothetical protein
MGKEISLDRILKPSEEVVAREIEGKIIIVPLTGGIGDMEDELFTLNTTGRAVWEKLDGKKSLNEIARELSADFDAPPEEIEKDVIGFVTELFKRRVVVEASAD